MNTKFLSTVAAIALMGSAAFAQTTNSTTETDSTAPAIPEATTGTDATTETDATESAPMTTEGETETDAAEGDAAMPAEGETETDAAEGDAAMPAEGEMETDAAEGDAAMPAEGEMETDAAEGDAAMPAEGEVETDAAEGDAAMPADGAADTDMAAGESAEEDRTAMYGPFADAPVSDVVGMNVLAANGDDVGEVDDLIREGDTVMAIIGVGGFLGLGEHKVALPLADFTMGEDALQMGEMSKEDLEALPAYEGEAESLPLDTTVSGEPIAQDELMTDPATGTATGTTAPTGG